MIGVQAETHLEELCPEWVFSIKTRRNVIETLLESGYQPDQVDRHDGSKDYRLSAFDGRYFSITATMYEYALLLLERDTKGCHIFKK